MQRRPPFLCNKTKTKKTHSTAFKTIRVAHSRKWLRVVSGRKINLSWDIDWLFSIGFCKRKSDRNLTCTQILTNTRIHSWRSKVVVLDRNEDTLLRGTSLDLLGRLCELAGETPSRRGGMKGMFYMWVHCGLILRFCVYGFKLCDYCWVRYQFGIQTY